MTSTASLLNLTPAAKHDMLLLSHEASTSNDKYHVFTSPSHIVSYLQSYRHGQQKLSNSSAWKMVAIVYTYKEDSPMTLLSQKIEIFGFCTVIVAQDLMHHILQSSSVSMPSLSTSCTKIHTCHMGVKRADGIYKSALSLDALQSSSSFACFIQRELIREVQEYNEGGGEKKNPTQHMAAIFSCGRDRFGVMVRTKTELLVDGSVDPSISKNFSTQIDSTTNQVDGWEYLVRCYIINRKDVCDNLFQTNATAVSNSLYTTAAACGDWNSHTVSNSSLKSPIESTKPVRNQHVGGNESISRNSNKVYSGIDHDRSGKEISHSSSNWFQDRNDASPVDTMTGQPPTKKLKLDSTSLVMNAIPHKDALLKDDATCVAIIVPYRDIHPAQNRAQHLSKFIPYMSSYLMKQMKRGNLIDYHIYIIEQSNDGRKFNRGKLLNIGFDLARKNKCRTSVSNDKKISTNDKNITSSVPHDVFIFHDVDLLPGDDLAQYYTTFPSTPMHIARVWNRYSNNPKYFGGIVAFSVSDMKRINGYPNNFWGWGGEDDEMQKRCEKLGIRWDYPIKGTITDLESMNIAEKLDMLRSNKSWKCMNKWEVLQEHEKQWRSNGLSDLSYLVLNMTALDVNKGDGDKSRVTKVTVDVKLNGTHWTNEKSDINCTT